MLVLLSGQAGSSDLTLNHYYGNLHAHTSYSDGSGTPDEAFKHAKKFLDFMAITEHNHDQAERGAKDRTDGLLIATNHDLYDELKEAADRHNDDGSFVTFFGQEFSTISSGNHSNIFQVRDVIGVDNGDYKALYSELTDHVLQFNHPWDGKNKNTAYGLGQFHGSVTKLGQAAAKNLRLIEVINGPGTINGTHMDATVKGESHYRYYLSRGLRLAPTADQDNHYFTWGDLTDARTVVLAPELTRTALLRALRQLRCYASTDKNIQVRFTVNGRLLGTEATAPTRSLKIKYEIEDPDEPNATYRVQIVYGNPRLFDSTKAKKLADVKGNHEAEHTFLTEHDHTFLYLRITQHPDKPAKTEHVLTAPVWISVTQ